MSHSNRENYFWKKRLSFSWKDALRMNFLSSFSIRKGTRHVCIITYEPLLYFNFQIKAAFLSDYSTSHPIKRPLGLTRNPNSISSAFLLLSQRNVEEREGFTWPSNSMLKWSKCETMRVIWYWGCAIYAPVERRKNEGLFSTP